MGAIELVAEALEEHLSTVSATLKIDEGELLRAAACYADDVANRIEGIEGDIPHPYWPWMANDWCPATTELGQMVQAAALICAEITRVMAAEARLEEPPW